MIKDKVQLIDFMGNDLTIVNSARVSFAKESEWAPFRNVGAKTLKKGDIGLIKYLAKHNHWTPFAQVQVQLRITMPIFVARQWFKHSVGVTRNEVSRRYVSNTPDYWRPSAWRQAATDKKQGSSAELNQHSDIWHKAYEKQCRAAILTYEGMIDDGIAPEMARAILPQGMYTEFIETGSLAYYARLYKLRNSPDAQLEIQQYAQAVGELIKPICPVSWGSLTDEQKN